MKKIFFLMMAVTLWCSVGKVTAQTPIVSFPHTEALNEGSYEYSFTLAVPSVVKVSQTGGSGGFVSAEIFSASGDFSNEIVSEALEGIFFGECLLSIYTDKSITLRVDVTPTTTETMTFPYNKKLTLPAFGDKWFKFTLTKETYLTGSILDNEVYLESYIFSSSGAILSLYFLDYENITLPSGVYYLKIRNSQEQSVAVDLAINAIDLSAIPSYTAINYTTALAKNTDVSGTLKTTDLGKYLEQWMEDGVPRTETGVALFKGYTLSVTAGKQYKFSYNTDYDDIRVYILKNGTLTGIMQEDVKFNTYYSFISDATENLRVLVLSWDIAKNIDYTLQVTENNAPVATMQLNDLFAAATTLNYTSLPGSWSVNFTSATPTVKMTLEREQTISWVTPATAYKMIIPSPNTGINFRIFPKVNGAAGLIYLKTGSSYEFVGEAGIGMTPSAGEYYLLLVNIPDVPPTGFDFRMWRDTDKEPGATPLKELLDATTSAVSLPYSTTGNISGGAFVPELYWADLTKVKAWKVRLAAESELYIRSNMVVVLYQSDGFGGYDEVGYYWGWDGSLDFDEWNTLPAGDYYVVAGFDDSYYDGYGDFWLKIGKNIDDVLSVKGVSIDAAYKVYTQANTIYASGVEVGLPYRLSDISGKTIASGITNSEALSLDVSQKGLYILSIGTQRQKALVR